MLLSLSFGITTTVIVVTAFIGIFLGWSFPVWVVPSLILVGLFGILFGATRSRGRG